MFSPVAGWPLPLSLHRCLYTVIRPIIPPGAWMSVCCECCVFSGRGLCDELITRSEESYWLWCVVVCDLETSWMRRPRPTRGLWCQEKNKNPSSCQIVKMLEFPWQIFEKFSRIRCTWWRKWERLKKTEENNGNLPLRTCSGCSVAELHQSPEWALVSAQTGPRAEYL